MALLRNEPGPPPQRITPQRSEPLDAPASATEKIRHAAPPRRTALLAAPLAAAALLFGTGASARPAGRGALAAASVAAIHQVGAATRQRAVEATSRPLSSAA